MAVKLSYSRALSSRKAGSFVFVLAVTLLFANSLVLAAETVRSNPHRQQTSNWAERNSASGVSRYRVFSLKHISAEQANKFLTEAGIGTVSQIPGTNTLLVTAQPHELNIASAILNLVDSEKKFVVKAILPASEAESLPSNDRIAEEVGDISVGTFSNPPARTEIGVIIDVHKDAVIAVAPVEQLEKIVSAIKRLQKPKTVKWPDGEPSGRPVVPGQVAAEIEKPGEVAPAVLKVRSYEPAPVANGDETLDLTLPEQLTIVQLLELVGEYLGLDYMYDPKKVVGDVTLKLQGELSGRIKVKDLYPLLESVLRFRGFVMARKGNLVTIVPAAEALSIDPALLDAEKGEIQPGDVIVTRIFNLKHIDTASAQNLLTGMKLGADIRPIVETKTLLVTGYAYRMGRIEEFLAMIDRPGELKQFRFRQLRYTMAKMLAPQIKTLAEQLGAVSITIAASAAAAPLARKPGESEAAYRARQAAAARAASARTAAARTAAARTTPAKPTGVYLDADERTNRILMIGLQEQLVVVEQLIDALDVEQQDLRTLQLYEIQYVGAEDAKKKLEEIGIIGQGQPVRTTSRAPVSPAPAKAPAPRPPASTTSATTTALVEEPQVVIIEATNSLLVNATAEQHAQIEQILAYVDSEAEEGIVPYEVYPLENQDPEELAGVLNQLIIETTTREDKDAKITTTRKRIEEDIFIIPDPKTYSLIVYASIKNQQWISSLIEQLDEYRPQVLLDVTLVEITKNEEFALDLDLMSKFPRLTPGATLDKLGFAPGITPFPSKSILEATSMAGAGGSAFYADEHIQLLLEAMHKKDYGRVLARPKLLVNDNEAGTIKTEEKQTIVSPETTVVPGTAATAPTAHTSVRFETYTAGITLDIAPHISKGDQLRLTITLTRTDFRIRPDYVITTPDQDITGPTPPDLLTSDVTTVVTVPDNTTIILGGLEKLSQNKGGTKVPILGDIPLVGGLFRSTANTDTQSRLYVFVKAHILRPGEELPGESDIEVVSAKNRATFERYEEEMQKYEDWPGIKPEPMAPVRILEAD